jgi:hypothetical protein
MVKCGGGGGMNGNAVMDAWEIVKFRLLPSLQKKTGLAVP